MHRSIVKKELEEGICWVCKSNFIRLHVHHINGNHKDNRINNLICLCSRCHTKTHILPKRRKQTMDHGQIDRILFLRRFLLKKMFGKDLDNYIKYEKAILNRIPVPNHHVCFSCGSKNHIKLIPPKFILKFDKENKNKLGFPLCKKCAKTIYTT